MHKKTAYKYEKHLGEWDITHTYVSGVDVEPQQSIRHISYDVADITGSQIAPIFSIVVFVVVNLTCFLIVAFCYMYIFMKANKTSEGASRTLDRNEQIRLAKKMLINNLHQILVLVTQTSSKMASTLCLTIFVKKLKTL